PPTPPLPSPPLFRSREARHEGESHPAASRLRSLDRRADKEQGPARSKGDRAPPRPLRRLLSSSVRFARSIEKAPPARSLAPAQPLLRRRPSGTRARRLGGGSIPGADKGNGTPR